MTEKAIIIGALVSLFATVINVVDQNIIKSFRKSGATSESNAISKNYQNSFQKWRFKRLIARKVICVVRADQFYLDEENLHAAKAKRRRRAFLFMIPSVIIIFLYFFLK